MRGKLGGIYISAGRSGGDFFGGRWFVLGEGILGWEDDGS